MGCNGCGEPDALRRLNNWSWCLFRWSEDVVGEPFRWGKTDCGALVRDAIRAMYGKFPAFGVPDWSDRRSAVEAQKATRGVSGALRWMGAEDVRLAYAQSGDVAVKPPRNGRKTFRAAVIVDAKLLIANQTKGVYRAPLSHIEPDTTVLRLPFALDVL